MDVDGLRDDLAKFADSVNRQGDAVSRLLLEHNTEFVKLWDDSASLRDDLHALANRVESLFQAMATSADLDDLRLEVRDALTTPFDPPEAA